MSYESNPAGLGVGKLYGARVAGNASGVLATGGSVFTAKFQLRGNEDSAFLEAQKVVLPTNATVQEVYVAVDEGFAATSTASVKLNGTLVTGAAAAITAVGTASPALSGTGSDLETGNAVGDLTVELSSAGKASTTGEVNILVRYIAG